MERAPELCFGALSTVPSMAPNDDLERGWRCPDVSTLPDSGSRDLVESQCTGSFDRDPDTYGIRALNSCRARHEHLFYFSLLDPATAELPASSGNRQRLSHIAI
jgi:hypothetical protein